jgi:hypothetical protein
MLKNGYSSGGKRERSRFRPSLGIDNGNPAVGGNQMHEVQKWDEGQPIY